MPPFGNSVKGRVLVECLYEGWTPHDTRCRRGVQERIALTKMGWVIEFLPRDLVIFRPWKGKVVKARLAPYISVYSNPPHPWRLVLGRTAPVLFDLREPCQGIMKPPPQPPDFGYLQQFTGPIHRLTQLLGRPPCEIEVCKEVYGNLDGALCIKNIKSIYKAGEGFFWYSTTQGYGGGMPKRRFYFVRTDMSIPKAEKMWKDQIMGSWEVEKNASNQN